MSCRMHDMLWHVVTSCDTIDGVWVWLNCRVVSFHRLLAAVTRALLMRLGLRWRPGSPGCCMKYPGYDFSHLLPSFFIIFQCYLQTTSHWLGLLDLFLHLLLHQVHLHSVLPHGKQYLCSREHTAFDEEQGPAWCDSRVLEGENQPLAS